MLACASADAQNILERLGNRAKNAAENNIGDKIEQGVNDLFNGKLGKKKDGGKDTGQVEQTAPEAKPAQTASPDGSWTCPNPECGHSGNMGKFCDECGTKNPAGSASSPQVATKPATQINWNNYDFVSGDEIIFEDTMEGEKLGEFPSRWDQLSGEAQITEINGVKTICISQAGAITPLFNDGKTYLTEECTVEYDIFIRAEEPWDAQFGSQEHGWASWMTLRTYLSSGDKIKEDQGGFSIEYNVVADKGEVFNPEIYYHWETPSGDSRSGSYQLKNVATEAWHHVAISFNKRAIKAYFDEQRFANIPSAAAPHFIWFEASNEDPYTYFIKNVRIAKGAVPLYDRLSSEGKIITYAITFDTGKATIKPESTGEINRIKDIMEKDPSLKFEVQGHCDNTGSDAVNDPLSQKRAEAIVTRLVELGIGADRLSAVGKGSHEPISDNGTEEGRAKNRRVEFVKK